MIKKNNIKSRLVHLSLLILLMSIHFSSFSSILYVNDLRDILDGGSSKEMKVLTGFNWKFKNTEEGCSVYRSYGNSIIVCNDILRYFLYDYGLKKKFQENVLDKCKLLTTTESTRIFTYKKDYYISITPVDLARYGQPREGLMIFFAKRRIHDDVSKLQAELKDVNSRPFGIPSDFSGFFGGTEGIYGNTPIAGSGSGFAISSDGLIVTNYHVVKDATKILVRGVDGDFTNTRIAEVVTTDQTNDLAIIRLKDTLFIDLGEIPYMIRTETGMVGEKVFVLGYPMPTTMGNDIKLTNGIISAKSGFKGDITTYQISAPVQPGNSGGPLFDEQGTLIGVINAKHGTAESASYAIKSSYLKTVIESIDPAPELNTVNKLSGKELTEQVELLSKFTYIIETGY